MYFWSQTTRLEGALEEEDLDKMARSRADMLVDMLVAGPKENDFCFSSLGSASLRLNPDDSARSWSSSSSSANEGLVFRVRQNRGYVGHSWFLQLLLE